MMTEQEEEMLSEARSALIRICRALGLSPGHECVPSLIAASCELAIARLKESAEPLHKFRGIHEVKFWPTREEVAAFVRAAAEREKQEHESSTRLTTGPSCLQSDAESGPGISQGAEDVSASQIRVSDCKSEVRGGEQPARSTKKHIRVPRLRDVTKVVTAPSGCAKDTLSGDDLIKRSIPYVEAEILAMQNERDPEYDYTEAQCSIAKQLQDAEDFKAEIEAYLATPPTEPKVYELPEGPGIWLGPEGWQCIAYIYEDHLWFTGFRESDRKLGIGPVTELPRGNWTPACLSVEERTHVPKPFPQHAYGQQGACECETCTRLKLTTATRQLTVAQAELEHLAKLLKLSAYYVNKHKGSPGPDDLSLKIEAALKPSKEQQP
jgi:hypothetical protein